jgi:hypothetical protein
MQERVVPALCLWMLEESQVESGEYQDNANIRYQPFPKTVSEERKIYADDDGYHHHRVKQASYSPAHFRGHRHFESSFIL